MANGGTDTDSIAIEFLLEEGEVAVVGEVAVIEDWSEDRFGEDGERVD